MGIDDGLALVGEAGLDKPGEQLEERLDAAEGLRPEADLGRRGQWDARLFEQELDPEDGALRPRQGPETEGLLFFGGIKGELGVWGKRGTRGTRKGALGCAFFRRKGALRFAFFDRKGALGFAFSIGSIGKRRTRLRLFFFSYLDTVGGEFAAALVGDHGQLAGLHQLFENLLDSAAAQAGFPLQRGLIGSALTAVIGVAGDGEEDDEM